MFKFNITIVMKAFGDLFIKQGHYCQIGLPLEEHGFDLMFYSPQWVLEFFLGYLFEVDASPLHCTKIVNQHYKYSLIATKIHISFF